MQKIIIPLIILGAILLWVLFIKLSFIFKYKQLNKSLNIYNKSVYFHRDTIKALILKTRENNNYGNEIFLELLIVTESGINELEQFLKDYKLLLNNLKKEEILLRKNKEHIKIGKYFNKKLSLYSKILNNLYEIFVYFNNIISLYNKLILSKNIDKINTIDKNRLQNVKGSLKNMMDNYRDAIEKVKNFDENKH